MRNERSAGFVIFRKSENGFLYLLLQNSSKFFWDFPKGNVAQGEDDLVAAKRELMEEAGITNIVPVEGFREQVSYSYNFDGETVHKDLVMFAAEAKDLNVTLSWEHSDFAWLTFKEAMSRLKDRKQYILDRAHKFLSKNNVS
jgi:8-oxo-dGTP pyrophosphatase MutT (NUDIX family)